MFTVTFHRTPRYGPRSWPKLKSLVKFVLYNKQVVLLSATLPHEILEMTSKFMTDPIRILVKR